MNILIGEQLARTSITHKQTQWFGFFCLQIKTKVFSVIAKTLELPATFSMKKKMRIFTFRMRNCICGSLQWIRMDTIRMAMATQNPTHECCFTFQQIWWLFSFRFVKLKIKRLFSLFNNIIYGDVLFNHWMQFFSEIYFTLNIALPRNVHKKIVIKSRLTQIHQMLLRFE